MPNITTCSSQMFHDAKSQLARQLAFIPYNAYLHQRQSIRYMDFAIAG